jgi:hypothetical protein
MLPFAFTWSAIRREVAAGEPVVTDRDLVRDLVLGEVLVLAGFSARGTRYPDTRRRAPGLRGGSTRLVS